MIEIIPNFHPALVHFPIAFATAAVAFIAIGTIFKNWPYATQCLMAGRWMLWGAALFAIIAAAFGWFASNSVAHDEVSHTAMMLHRNWALGTLTALLALTSWDLWRGRSGRMPSPNIPSPGFLVLLVAAWLLVTSTAWHGAELVYRHGLGVMPIPKPEGSGHAHDHGEDHGGMSVQGKGMPHDDGHAHTDGASTAPKKPGHTHAPGVPPHKD